MEGKHAKGKSTGTSVHKKKERKNKIRLLYLLGKTYDVLFSTCKILGSLRLYTEVLNIFV